MVRRESPLAEVHSLLVVLKEMSSISTSVIEAALDAACARASDLRSGKDAKGFKAKLKVELLARSEALHDRIGQEALDESQGASVAGDTDDIGERRRGDLRTALSEATLEVVRHADFGVLGGTVVRAAALLRANEAMAKKMKALLNPKKGGKP